MFFAPHFNGWSSHEELTTAVLFPSELGLATYTSREEGSLNRDSAVRAHF
jgi:hypothetical protein